MKDDDPNSASKLLNSGEKREVDLWEYLTEIASNLRCSSEPILFKCKEPKKYIQVKT